MNKVKYLLLVSISGMLSVSFPIFAANSPDARDVLRRFTEARKNLTSFIIKVKMENTYNCPVYNWGDTMYGASEFRFDGVRGRVSSDMWGNINMANPDVPEDQPLYTSRLWEGENFYSYSRSATPAKGHLMMNRVKDPGGVPKSYTEFVQNSIVPGLMMGYIRGNSDRQIEEVLNRAEDLDLRQEELRGVNCYVIDTVVKEKGSYTLWIDPTHDYHIVKLHVLRKGGDYYGEAKIPKNDSSDMTVEVLDFQQIADSWFPKRYKKMEIVISKGVFEEHTVISDITSIVLNPDHDALKSFTPYDIPNGAPVTIMAFHKVKYVWQDGKPVRTEEN